MRSNTLRAAITLCAAASLAAAMAPASATGTAPPAAASRRAEVPVLVDCTFAPQVRPTDFILACGDGNSRLASLHWSQWGPAKAVATGTNWVNDCKPYCAAGKFHAYKVAVRLDHPHAWTKHPDRQHYTRITLTYTDGTPDPSTRVTTWPLWN
ncbi:hypothetical protein EOT10_21525 [Streptomyces antnestii]|uniref:Secreted protein n=1 Tax=Streptomyces antnestii TaxID=2494256 RepID=A0A3S2XTD3_9ACTN|nr:hypothetical protein [Streptomyces sp. San01]RVU22546.1 hypothetical protein EOT10_21525 [Streptomyces sp. San01]